MTWIRCADRLPDPGMDVLVYFPQYSGWQIGSRVNEVQHWREEWSTARGRISLSFGTHWQPLPEPPTGLEA